MTVKRRSAKAAKKRKYGPAATRLVKEELARQKRGTLRSGKKGRGGKVKSRKQAIAIALSEARKARAKVPRRKGA